MEGLKGSKGAPGLFGLDGPDGFQGYKVFLQKKELFIFRMGLKYFAFYIF